MTGKSVRKQAEVLAARCRFCRPWVIVSEIDLGDSHKIRTEGIVYDLVVVRVPCCRYGKHGRKTFILAKIKRVRTAELRTGGKVSTFPASEPAYESEDWCVECAKSRAAEQGGTLDWLIAES
jgi:hypothetical protein